MSALVGGNMGCSTCFQECETDQRETLEEKTQFHGHIVDTLHLIGN